MRLQESPAKGLPIVVWIRDSRADIQGISLFFVGGGDPRNPLLKEIEGPVPFRKAQSTDRTPNIININTWSRTIFEAARRNTTDLK